VYGIVKQNRGFITVYSEPGRGTTFKIHLPRCSEQVQENVRPSERPAIRPGGHETILLVEDEKSVRVTTTQFFKKTGYNVLAAENPELALHLAAQHAGEIDLLITDVVMPGMSGRDLAARLSALRPGVKCLYISGFTADIIAQEGILVDGLLFMTKPFSRDELVRKVSMVLDSDKETLTVQGQEGELDPGRRIDPMSTPTDSQ
jgi:two-component system cell cycle sensor histidine kinase/response regulator CckA